MSKSKFINLIIIMSMLWLAVGGSAAQQPAQAQTSDPPATDDALPLEKLPELPQGPTTPVSDDLSNSDSWIKPLPYDPQAGIESVMLWNNGPLVTHPGGGYNGADASRLQALLGMIIFGFGEQFSAGNRMADEFEVTDSAGWQIETITFFSYQTSSDYADPPLSTITGVYLQIWDGSPDNPASSVVFGDLVTNRMHETYWTGIYRDNETSPVNNQRPIMTAVANVNYSLGPGTYWLDWMVDGSGSSGPWAPPITILGQTTTGNALQYTPSSGAWNPAIDTGTLTQQGMPFVIEGSINSASLNWKSIAPINSVGRTRPAAAAVNGKIYLIGGTIIGGYANTVEEYDPRFNTWTTQAGSMPTPATSICAAVIGTDIYIPGGFNDSFLRTLQVYHTNTDTWSTITTDPLPFRLFGSGCAALNGKLYVFGGYDPDGYLSSAYVYDPAAGAGSRWTTLPSMAHARAFLAGVAANGKIYAIGGRTVSGNENLDYVEAYNPADGSWHTVTPLQTPRGGVGAYAVGNTIYACAGGWSTYLDTCEVYDTTQGYAGSWTTHPALLIDGRCNFAYANIGPTLYAIAGYNGTYLTTAERWSYETFLPLIQKEPFTTLGFDSQFNGDAMGWFTYSGVWYSDSTNFYTDGLDNLWSTAAYTLPFDNLDYTVRMMRLGCDTCATNLLIRGDPYPLDSGNRWDDYYAFQYGRNGFFSINKRINGSLTTIQPWTDTDAINQGDAWNTFRVFARGSSLYFSINGTLVWSGTDSSLTSGRVGIGMYGSTAPGDELRIDWATLYTDGGTFAFSDTVSPEQQLLNDEANLNPIGDETGY